MPGDSRLWQEAYSSFKLAKPTNNSPTVKSLRKKSRRIKKGKIAHIRFNASRTPDSITETTKEFYRWKKTEGYLKWRKSRFLKQGGLCFYCEVFMPFTRINVEHIIPRSRGGSNKPENLALSCSSCNKDKGSKMLTEADILKFKSRSKKHKGTYLKNKEYYDNIYGEYSDTSINEKYKQFRG